MTENFPRTRNSCHVSAPEDAGFASHSSDRLGPWRNADRPEFEFRLLRTFQELESIESLQRAVFGVTDRDLMAASMLVVLSETGGDVIGVFDTSVEPARLAGFLTALGGFAHRSPRLCSDMLAIHPDYRHAGLGALVKRLQAALAIERGFEFVLWTVDPLRAVNARLNFGKLGAFSDHYERDRYGSTYGSGLYGGMPTDRLHITWPIRSARVQRMLKGKSIPPSAPAIETVTLPADIDALITSDISKAVEWRFRVREQLEGGLRRGLIVSGYGVDDFGAPVLLLTEGSMIEKDHCS